MTLPAIAVKSVSKSFRRGTPVLKAIDLEIAPGEMVALIGASGSGKSTLIRLLSGLERADPGPGTISMLGRLVQRDGRRTPAQRQLRRDIGVVFQQFNLVGRLSLLTNVLAGRLGRVPGWRGLLGLFSRRDRVRALQSLERVGMVAFAHQRASELSGGQQQRGAIARTLAQEARIILADEPIASLDPASAERVMEILAEINRIDRTTVIVSLHQIDHAFRHCPRIVALKDGCIVFDGPRTDIRPEDLSALYGLDMAQAVSELDGTSHAHEVQGVGGRASAGARHELRPSVAAQS
ncbi:MAG: phosphonate ABC transporter ATP-binding protein [Hyphomicrobiaceae bacterium]